MEAITARSKRRIESGLFMTMDLPELEQQVKVDNQLFRSAYYGS
jgi:hypothetical protein